MPDDKLSTGLPDIMKPSFGKRGIAGQRAKVEAQLKDLDPLTVPNRLGIIFDNSGSMGSIAPSGNRAVDDAKTGVRNFLASCKSLETSVCIYPFQKEGTVLTCDYSVLNIYVAGLDANAGTPLYTTMIKLLNDQKITRGVIFSDGEPTDDSRYSWEHDKPESTKSKKEQAIEAAKSKEMPFDTIFIGDKEASGYKEMKWIAEQTGGIFINFEDSYSLSKNLKYLSPGLRFLLANEELKKKVERGETI